MKLEDRTPRPMADRIFGLARASFYGFLTYEIIKETSLPIDIPILTIGSLLTLDGLVDLVSGEMHYAPVKVIKYFENRRNRKCKLIF